MTTDMYDYIVVGGGLAGSVVASRLFQRDRTLKILVVEAGPDVSKREDIMYMSSTNTVLGDFDWKYSTVPQTHLNNRQIGNSAGRCLGGGSAINSCGWMRGPRQDYEDWASLVNDQRWSYAGQMPYFKASEEWWSKTQNAEQHGHDGPLHIASVSSTGRKYPLREKVEQAWHELGVESLPELDMNAGDNLGVGELAENRRQGVRQIASSVYSLEGVTVMTETLVECILMEKAPDGTGWKAVGIRLANGTELCADKVIASAGAYRTPQLLMLSGIGPAELLQKHDIDVKVDSPEVGSNLADHMMLFQWWRLKNPEKGYAIASANPIFAEPAFGMGNPNELITSTAVPKDGLAAAIAEDEGAVPDAETHPLLRQTQAMLESFVLYVAAPSPNPVVPVDGTHVTTAVVGLKPTSRGTVTIASKDASADPVIDPNYLATAVDRYVWRQGLRNMHRLVNSEATVLGRDIVDSETPPSGFSPMSAEASDADLDARVRASAFSTWHPMGSCAMGKVVDSGLRLRGVEGLYVADASAIPVPIGAHIQAAVYALAEQAAVVISEGA